MALRLLAEALAPRDRARDGFRPELQRRGDPREHVGQRPLVAARAGMGRRPLPRLSGLLAAPGEPVPERACVLDAAHAELVVPTAERGRGPRRDDRDARERGGGVDLERDL